MGSPGDQTQRTTARNMTMAVRIGTASACGLEDVLHPALVAEQEHPRRAHVEQERDIDAEHELVGVRQIPVAGSDWMSEKWKSTAAASMGAPALLRTSSSSGGTHMPVSEMRTMMNAGTKTLNAAESRSGRP